MISLQAFVPFLLAVGSAALTPSNLVTPATSGALSSLKYSNVGGTGQYNQVVNMVAGAWPSCTVKNACQTASKQVSGALAPFDEELTMVFRAPLTLHDVAVYQPATASGATWEEVSSWSQGSQPKNLVFMNNKGGSKSGEWDTCGGSSQSYANGAWDDATTAANAEFYTGKLTGTNEVNIVTGTPCSAPGNSCDGFSRGTANHGWSGSKMFVVTFEMPSDGTSNLPAIWILNSQVTNAAQYGCNCRGMGGDGGCGEIDVLETLSANVNQGITELYSFKGATGSGNGNFFPRPLSGLVTYAVIFDVQTDSIMIQRLSSWDFTQSSVSRSLIDAYLGVKSMQVSFKTSARRSVGERGAHRRRHH